MQYAQLKRNTCSSTISDLTSKRIYEPVTRASQAKWHAAGLIAPPPPQYAALDQNPARSRRTKPTFFTASAINTLKYIVVSLCILTQHISADISSWEEKIIRPLISKSETLKLIIDKHSIIMASGSGCLWLKCCQRRHSASRC